MRLVLAAKREVVVVAFRVKEDGALGLAAQHACGAWIGSEQRGRSASIFSLSRTELSASGSSCRRRLCFLSFFLCLRCSRSSSSRSFLRLCRRLRHRGGPFGAFYLAAANWIFRVAVEVVEVVEVAEVAEAVFLMVARMV